MYNNNMYGGRQSWVDKLERRFGHLAIPNLMLYVTSTMVVFYIFDTVQRGFSIIDVTALYPAAVLRGQVWRLITFVFTPPGGNSLTMLLVIYFYYSIGQTLERYWGSFRFNLYYLCGMVGAILAAFIAGSGTNTYLNLSLFLAVATLFPDMEVLLFFIIPIKLKYLAYLDLALFGIAILLGNNTLRVAALLSLMNYFLFFGLDFIKGAKRDFENRRRQQTFRNNQNNWR